MAEAIKINENTYRIEDGHVRFYLFIGNKKAALRISVKKRSEELL